MKTTLRMFGTFLLLASIVVFVISGIIKHDNKPTELTHGYVINGEFTEIDKSYIGHDSKTEKLTDILDVFGVISVVAGVGSFVVSFMIKQEKTNKYDEY